MTGLLLELALVAFESGFEVAAVFVAVVDWPLEDVEDQAGTVDHSVYPPR